MSMDFISCKDSMTGSAVFSTGDMAKVWGKISASNLVHWQEHGYIIKLQNNWYAFPNELKTESDLYRIANRLLKPSYISLETALRYYNFIPESVFSVTSVSTSKPNTWDTSVGHFSYRNNKPSAFFGYRVVDGYKIADPEKALLDTLYYKPELADKADFEMYRFNQNAILSLLDCQRMETYVSVLCSKTLERRWKLLQKRLAL